MEHFSRRFPKPRLSWRARARIDLDNPFKINEIDCRLDDTIIVTGQEKSLILGVVSDFLGIRVLPICFGLRARLRFGVGLGLKSNKPRTVQQIRSA